MKLKVDKVNIEKGILGYEVQAIRLKDGKEVQVGDKAIVQSEFEAILYITNHYELP